MIYINEPLQKFINKENKEYMFVPYDENCTYSIVDFDKCKKYFYDGANYCLYQINVIGRNLNYDGFLVYGYEEGIMGLHATSTDDYNYDEIHSIRSSILKRIDSKQILVFSDQNDFVKLKLKY